MRTHNVDEKTGAKIGINRYAFLADRLPQSSIFKIPQQKATVMVVEGQYPKEEEFKGMAEIHKLTGAKFEELWGSSSQIISSTSRLWLPAAPIPYG